MRVYVAGNISVDETYLIDDLPHKGASIHGMKDHQDLGGKGANQAIILSRCGINTTLIAATGNDSQGSWCKDKINFESLTLFPEQPGEYRTDTSLILNCADGDNANITTTTAADALSIGDVIQALSCSTSDDVLLQQGNFSVDKTAAIFSLARQKNMTTVFNPSPVKTLFATLLPMVDILVVNQLEAQLLSNENDTLRAANALLSAGVRQVVVTLGAQGSLLLDATGLTEIAAQPVTVKDTTGAGDTFLGVMLASSLLRQAPVSATDLRIAARASAITIGRTGTLSAFPTRSELTAILSADE